MLIKYSLFVISTIFLFGCSQHSQTTSAQNREVSNNVTVGRENVQTSPEDVVAEYYSAAIAPSVESIQDLVMIMPSDYKTKLKEDAFRRLNPGKNVPDENELSNDKPGLAESEIDQLMLDEILKKYPEYLRDTRATVSKIGKAEIMGGLASVTVTLRWPDGRFPDDKEIVHLGRQSDSWRIFKIGSTEWENVMP